MRKSIQISSGSTPPGSEPFFINLNPGSPTGAKHYESKAALWQDLSDCVPSACEEGLGNLIEQLKENGHVVIPADLSPDCVKRLSLPSSS
jgi:hypothetical protein